jgi:hypothetical protein
MSPRLMLSASLFLAVALTGCGPSTREKTYSKDEAPAIRNVPAAGVDTAVANVVSVKLTAFRQLEESVAFRVVISNEGNERLLIPCKKAPLYQTVQVHIGGKSFPCIIAPNELPADGFFEGFIGLSAMRSTRDWASTMTADGIGINPKDFIRLEMKAELKEKLPVETPWSLELQVVDLQGKEVLHDTLYPDPSLKPALAAPK